jgi:hypothetical protein
MTGEIEERTYLWQRRYIFAVTLGAVIVLPILIALLA